MISTSGTRLLKLGAVQTLCRRLLPLAALITPNLHEAEVLLETKLRTVEDMRRAARQLRKRFGVAVLVKGGHLKGILEAIDIFYDGTEELLLSAPFVRGIRTHGTGCTYSAAITAYLAKGFPLSESIAKAKQFVANAIAKSHAVGGHCVLDFSQQ
jgi:hydroxymethylpyrimidine kinase/phosphomethylpyrimidine kinase